MGIGNQGEHVFKLDTYTLTLWNLSKQDIWGVPGGWLPRSEGACFAGPTEQTDSVSLLRGSWLTGSFQWKQDLGQPMGEN